MTSQRGNRTKSQQRVALSSGRCKQGAKCASLFWRCERKAEGLLPLPVQRLESRPYVTVPVSVVLVQFLPLFGGKRQTLRQRPPPVHFLRRSCFIFSRAAPCRVNYAWTAWNRVDGYLSLSVRSGVSNRESGIAAHSWRHAGISLTRPRVTVGRDSCADVARRRCQIVAPSGISAFYSPCPPAPFSSHAASLSAL